MKQRRVFGKKKKSFVSRLLRKSLGIILSLVGAIALGAYLILYLSQPKYEGELEYIGLSSSITIERDSLGTASIAAANRNDLAFALGWIHAQERFFQMDMLRRNSAGELSEIIGAVTLEKDKQVRQHRFRARAQQVINRLNNKERSILQSYARGVNEGYQALTIPPFEYWLLNAQPEPWQEEDSILVVYSMYLQLQPSTIEREKVLQLGYQSLPNDLYRFLVPDGTRFDAAIDFSQLELPPIPDQIDLPNLNQPIEKEPDPVDIEHAPGSNNFAVARGRSAEAKAIVASDMHLGHGIPNIWFKANLEYKQHSETVELAGVTLPGTPLLIAGTNENIAWSFTNSYGDYFDSIPLKRHPENANLYQWDGEWHEFTHYKETLTIKGDDKQSLLIKETLFGPVLLEEKDKVWSHFWVAHSPKAMNLGLLQLETASSIEQALEIANKTAIPAQNFVAADRKGRIGWTLIGALPKRQNSNNPLTTIAHQQGKIIWQSPEDYPRVINPESDVLWTANGRVMGNEEFQKLGNGGYALGVRGKLIRDKLLKLNNATEQDLLAIQLDTDAELYLRWQKHLLSLLDDSQLTNENRKELKQLVQEWNGKANTDQAGFTLLRAYRFKLREILLDPLVKAMDPDAKYSFAYYSKQYEYPLWQIVTHQPQGFLPKDYENYSSLFSAAVDAVIAQYTADNQPLADQVWGKYNTVNIQHPISRALPILSWLLDRPKMPLPGEAHSPRVQGKTFGASQRMVISPGDKDQAIFHMPGGQSGHPLSPFYELGFNDWASGNPTPLWAQEPQYQLTLKPKRAAND